MARYKIYDNTSDVITPVGEKLTAEQWLDRYQWGRYTKMIVGGGIINGSVALVFDDEVEHYRKAGCDFSSSTTSSSSMRTASLPLQANSRTRKLGESCRVESRVMEYSLMDISNPFSSWAPLIGELARSA